MATSMLRRSMFRTTRPLFDARAQSGHKLASSEVLKREAQKNPELYVLFAVIAGTFGMAGLYFSRNPTGTSKEQKIAQVPGSEPWNTGKDAKYQYYPYGDTSVEKKDAPSPLRVSIIPNVNLPRELHEQFNKYGKDEYP